MTVINSNSAALRAQNGTRIANQELQTAMARLSSGKRINSAADDAAGLAISNSMTSQINGMTQAIANANDGVSMAQTADGALTEVTNNLQRIRELAVQSASGTYSASDRTNMQAEVGQLEQQINSTLSSTQFNGVNLFDGTAGTSGTVTIQTGSNSGDTVSMNFGKIDLSAITGGTTAAVPAVKQATSGSYTVVAGDNYVGQSYTAGSNDTSSSINGSTPTSGSSYTLKAGDTIYVASGTTTTNAVAAGTTAGIDVSSVADATAALTKLDTAITTVSNAQAVFGASESRLNSVVNNLTNNVTNLTDANSRISDADFSVETTNLAKAQILSQASTAMLAQANQSQQGVLKLLQ